MRSPNPYDACTACSDGVHEPDADPRESRALRRNTSSAAGVTTHGSRCSKVRILVSRLTSNRLTPSALNRNRVKHPGRTSGLLMANQAAMEQRHMVPV